MKVLILTHYFLPHRGGIETVAYEHAKKLVQTGNPVSIVTSRLKDDPAFLKQDGIDIYRISTWNPFERHGIPYPVFGFELFQKLWSLIQTHDGVIVHSHSFMPSVIGSVLSRILKKPVVVLQHNTKLTYHFPWNILQAVADQILGRTTLSLAKSRYAVSEETAKYVREILFPSKKSVQVLYNGVDTSRFFPASSEPEKVQLRKKLGLKENAFCVFSIRRMVFKNGLGDLVEAASLLKNEPGIQWIMGGTGPDLAHLKKTVEDQGLKNIKILGFVSDQDLPLFYRAADVLVLPSVSGEGLPLVILEAFASGVPAIVTRTGGQVELVTPEKTGWWIQPSAPQELASTVKKASQNLAMTRQLGKNSRTLAESLDWNEQVQQLIQPLKSKLL